MVKITTPSPDFNFENISLSKPIVLNEGTFYSKIVDQDKETITIQSPQCKTKGIMNINKKIYTDLVFDGNNAVFTSWINSLEERIQQEIYNNRETWFVSSEIELDDIQLAFLPVLKLYKGSSYITRTYIQNGTSDVKNQRIQVYNEDETPRDIEDVKEDDNVIAILEFQGIKFSQRSFQLYIIVKQIMILESTQLSHCIINKQPNIQEEPKKEEPEEEPQEINKENENVEVVDIVIQPSRRKRLLIQYLESRHIKEMSALEEIETDSD